MPLAWVWGVRGRALSHPRSLVLSGVRPGPASHWPWVRCAGVGARLSLAPSPVPRFVVCCARFLGSRWLLWLGTCPRAVVVADSVPLWRASWPNVGAPCLIWSGHSRCSGRLSRRRGAFPHPGGCRPGFTGWLRGARGGWPGTGLIVPAAGPCRGKGAGLAPRRRGPAMGLSLAGPSGFGLWLRALRLFPCVDRVTDASGFLYRPSFDGGLGRRTGAVFVWMPTPPLSDRWVAYQVRASEALGESIVRE